jgi:hypothetical protein
MSACPYRATFYPKLAATPEECDEKLSKWLAALDNIVKKEQAFYTAGKHDKGF